MRSRARLLAFGATLFALGIVVGSATGGTFAAFSGTASNGTNSFGAKRIFPGSRVTPAWDLRDASSGTESNVSDPYSFGGDGRTVVSTGNMSSGSNAYFEFTMSAQLPAGVSVSGAQFNFTFASNGGLGSQNGCFWFEVRSGGSVIGTHGSYSSAVGCSSGSTLATFNTSIPEVTTTDQMNGLAVRVYAWETAGKKIKVDMGTVTGSTPYMSFTSYEISVVDTSSGTVTTLWSLTASDGTAYTTASNWGSSFASTKYLKFTFPAYVPSGAVVSSVTFNHSYKSNTSGDTTCYYFEVYNGSTLLATHGSSSSPVSCNSTSSFVTDNVSLTEVDTATKADNLVIKVYMKDSGPKKTQTDLATVSLNYYLD